MERRSLSLTTAPGVKNWNQWCISARQLKKAFVGTTTTMRRLSAVPARLSRYSSCKMIACSAATPDL